MKNRIFLFLFQIFFVSVFGQNIVGSWKAELDIQGTKLPLIINISKTAEQYSATLDSPMQNTAGIPVSKIEFRNNKLVFESSAIGLHYSGTLVSEQKIEGKFSQNGFEAPLVFFPLDNKPVKTLGKLPADYQQNLMKIGEFLTYLEKNNLEAGKISIFKDGKEVFERTFGENNLPGNSAENRYFQIGSITKTMTAVMIHKLAEERKISLNTKLSSYFPQFPNADKITIEQMLNHTSGLGDYVENEKELKWLTRSASEKEIMAHMMTQKSVFLPGTSTKYSNTAYYLLTKILEKETGKSFAENLNQMILKPNKMQNTFPAELSPKNVFPGYSYANGWTETKDFDFNNVIGVGDIAADPKDLNIFINQLFSGKILPLNTVEDIKPQSDNRFGLGIAAVPFFSKTFYGHSGGTYGTNSLMIYSEEDRISLAYSLNADRIDSNRFVTGILSLLYGIDYEFPVANNTIIAEEQLNLYSGTYTSPQMPLEIRIFVENAALFAQGTGQPSFPLEFVEGDTFKFDQANLKITFRPKENKMELTQNGVKYEFTRK